GHGDKLLFLQPSAEQDTGHHRNHVAEMRNRTDEALFHVAEVDIQIFSTRWAAGFRHVLRKDFARADAFYENGAEIANQRRDEILRLQCVSAADGSCFLAQRAKNTADDFRLSIEIHEPLFDEAREFQVAIEFELLLGFERRFGRATERLSVNRLA